MKKILTLAFFIIICLLTINPITLAMAQSPAIMGNYNTPGTAKAVVISGNYAYVADGESGLQIIDVSNPKGPFLVGSVDTPGDATDIEVVGNRAYIADGSAGLQIIDVVNPTKPTIVGRRRVFDQIVYTVKISGSYAFLYVYPYEKVAIVDMSNPASVPLVYSPPLIPMQRDINLSGNYLYTSHSGGSMGGAWDFAVTDVSNPSYPHYVGGYGGRGRSGRVSYVSGNYAYGTDVGIFFILDDSNPSKPVKVGECNIPTAGKVFVSGKYAYVGRSIVDISNPSDPKFVDSFEIGNSFNDLFVVGKYAYIANGEYGLAIIDISYYTEGYGEIYGRVVNRPGRAIPGTAVRIDNTFMPTNAGGEFRFTLVRPGIYTVYYDAPGYVGQTQIIQVRARTTTKPPTVIMSRLGEIYGRVVNQAGQAIPGTCIRINSSLMPTNPAGEFRFTLVYPGTYTIYYDAPGYIGQKQEAIVVEAEKEARPPMVILSTMQGEIRGKIVDSTGRPIPGATIRIDNTVMTADANGDFRFTMVYPNIYTLHYDAPGYKPQTQEIVVAPGRVIIPPTVILPP